MTLLTFLKDKTKLTRNGKILLAVNFILLFSSVTSLIGDFIQPAIILGIGTIVTSVMLWVVSEKPIGSLSIKKENA